MRQAVPYVYGWPDALRCTVTVICVPGKFDFPVRRSPQKSTGCFGHPGKQLAAGQIIGIKGLHQIGSIAGQGVVGNGYAAPLRYQPGEFPQCHRKLILNGSQPGRLYAIKQGHSVIGIDFVGIAGLTDGLDGPVGACQGSLAGCLPVVGQPGSGCNRQIGSRLHPDGDFQLIGAGCAGT